MKRAAFLVTCLVAVMFLLNACNGHQAHQQYMQAYHQLWEANSFVVERNATLVTSGFSTTTVETYYIVRSENGDMLTANIVFDNMDDAPTMINLYYRDDYVYSQNITNPEENFRIQREADYPMICAIEGIIEFPKNVIAKQSIQDTPDGKLLTFEFDSEKYYEYRFPPSDNDGYRYGEFSSYREPPIYTVLLDDQERIKQVSGNFCTVNSNAQRSIWDQSYTITFTQYEDVELDFSGLNEADYPIL